MPLTERGLTVAVTGSPMDIVRALCERLGIDGAYGTIMHAYEGLYTGRLDLTVMNNKGHVIRHLAAELGIDLAASAAFGDSPLDLPMLKEVGYPFAMNPDAAMLKELRKYPNITMVQDRQKSGLQFYRAGQDGLFKGFQRKMFCHRTSRLSPDVCLLNRQGYCCRPERNVVESKDLMGGPSTSSGRR
jgi:hypothetical protein